MNIFEERNVKNIIFDLDDTLLQTNLYYRVHMSDMAKYIAQALGSSNIDRDVETILTEAIGIHKQVAHPMLINELMSKTLVSIYGEDFEKNEEIFKYLEDTANTFYKSSPLLVEDTLPVLNMVFNSNINIGVYSHAQTDWTKIKVEYIQSEFKNRYDRDIDIQYYCTPIESKKDKEGWQKALDTFGFEKEDTMIVGDNLRDDIIPAQEIGIKRLVLILNSRYSNNVQHNGNGVIKIEELKDLLTL